MAKKQEAEGVSLWERLERPAATPRTSLTPRKIAAVAVDIADREGFAAVTMRKIAAELGVAPMAAYRHVDGKDELWALMVDQVSAELEPGEAGEPGEGEPGEASAARAAGVTGEAGRASGGGAADTADDAVPGWRRTLRAHALRTRASMLRHPWLAQLPAPLFALTPRRMAAAERQLAALDGLGLDVDTMMAAFRAVNAYVHGATQAEAALRQYMAAQGWENGDETRRGLAPQMSYLMETGRYPTYRRYTRGAARKDDAAWQFETGLDCVLDGVAGLVERAAGNA